MELKTAIEILEYHQEWRLGKREDMIHEPKKLTEALDVALLELKKTNSTFYCKNRVFVENYHGTHCTFQCAECRKGAPSVLIAYGEENAEILKNCDIKGRYVRLS